ncbi:MAG: chromosome partitioning protein ParB [Frankiales bacterium]|nr:chromosome partitioning protein ParB [Frankiales bacterium]
MTQPKRGGLGRGLGALIPQGPTDDGDVPAFELASVDGARFAELPLDAIVPNAVQPRQVFDEEALAELVHSIREVGLLQPIVVRPQGEGRYELIMGERRWRASQRAGLTTIPAIVRHTQDDAMLRDALLENLHRSQLNPLEEAAAYQQLLADFGTTHEELAQRIGRSRPQISNTIRLLNLPATVQSKVAAGVLSAGHARAILGLPTAAAMDAMAHRVIAEGMSVRSTEEAVALAVSDAPAPRRGAAQKRLVPEAAREVADRLSDRLETRVKVDVGRSKGKITIEFATLEDLQRIADIVQGPQAD